MRQSNDPSVEDILESIKKVIARDNRASAAAQRRQRANGGIAAPAPADEHEDEDDVLDLAVSAQFLDSLDDVDDLVADPALITPDARAAMRESLAALAMVAQPGAAPQIVRSGETSLEGLVREMLRPALAEWLDHNLPALVERMVAAEIAKIVGKKA